jgi:aminotransferase in exopolysaccharide biosynthesis
MFNDFVQFVREVYGTNEFIPLHAPQFNGNEKKYLLDTIDSTFVSSVGEYVDRFERDIAEYTGSKYAVAVVNGTAALHISLKLAGVEGNSEVITQSLTFVATCNAIRYCNAVPVFVDVDRSTMSLSPVSLKAFLEEFAEIRDDGCCWNKASNRKITAVMPMHTFGFPAQLSEIKQLCDAYHLVLVEDAAESLGSWYKGIHTGLIGDISAISFNGNKIITTGGGGVILTNDESIAKRAKHITTTAKIPHRWDFDHDEVGFNYRMPNLNAALGVAQLEVLPSYIENKRKLAEHYQQWGKQQGLHIVKEPDNTKSNYWLNTLIAEDKKTRDVFLHETNENGVMTRPIWKPMHSLVINQGCQHDVLQNTVWLADRAANIPSSVIVA